MLICFLLAGILFLSAITLFIMGIVKKSRKAIYTALICLFVAAGAGLYGGILLANSAYHLIKEGQNPFKRTGLKMYTALFDAPVDTCLHVINAQDQYVPRVDCCMWLEFRTCPTELNRIIAQKKYKPASLSDLDAPDNYVPSNLSPRPTWFTPQILGDGMHILRKFNYDDPNHDLILYFSADSTHAFYIDMAE